MDIRLSHSALETLMLRNISPKHQDITLRIKRAIYAHTTKTIVLKSIGDCLVCTHPLAKDRTGHVQLQWQTGRGYVHRIVFSLLVSTAPAELHVLHKCNVAECCNPDHLYLGTDADNGRDRAEAGVLAQCRGTDNHRAKLTKDAVLDIRTKRLSQRQFGTMYGVSHTVVKLVQQRKTYLNIED